MEKKDKISIETMTGVGIKKKIAGREYYIVPINIVDMHYVMGAEGSEDNLIILSKKNLEENEDINWQLFGLNITEDARRKTFIKMISKYVFYITNDTQIPMSEELLIEHNWSFKEIGEFLFTWCQISD